MWQTVSSGLTYLDSRLTIFFSLRIILICRFTLTSLNSWFLKHTERKHQDCWRRRRSLNIPGRVTLSLFTSSLLFQDSPPHILINACIWLSTNLWYFMIYEASYLPSYMEGKENFSRNFYCLLLTVHLIWRFLVRHFFWFGHVTVLNCEVEFLDLEFLKGDKKTFIQTLSHFDVCYFDDK